MCQVSLPRGDVAVVADRVAILIIIMCVSYQFQGPLWQWLVTMLYHQYYFYSVGVVADDVVLVISIVSVW